MLQNVTNKY